MARKSQLEEVQEQAALFALGALPVEEAERFSERLRAKCPLCRAELRDCEQAAAALAFDAPAVAPPPGLRRRLLETVDREAESAHPALAGIVVRPGDTEWRAAPVPGVQVRVLHGETMLVRMAPKTTYPAHDHRAAEQCLVLEGSVTSAGITARAGDFTYMPAGSNHPPLYSEEGCLLLIAYT